MRQAWCHVLEGVVVFGSVIWRRQTYKQMMRIEHDECCAADQARILRE